MSVTPKVKTAWDRIATQLTNADGDGTNYTFNLLTENVTQGWPPWTEQGPRPPNRPHVYVYPPRGASVQEPSRANLGDYSRDWVFAIEGYTSDDGTGTSYSRAVQAMLLLNDIQKAIETDQTLNNTAVLLVVRGQDFDDGDGMMGSGMGWCYCEVVVTLQNETGI